MKIRIDRKMYSKAQRIADSQNMTFIRWQFATSIAYGRTGDIPKIPLEKVPRKNSVSVAVSIPKGWTITPKRIAECIALAIEDQNNRDNAWPFRYDRSSLDAVVQLETFLGRSCDYNQAQEYIDKRLAERKAEIAAESKHTKKGRK